MQSLPPPVDAADSSAEAFDLTLKRLALLLRLARGAWVLAVYRDHRVRQWVTEELRVRVAPLPLIKISLARREPDLRAILEKEAGDEPEGPVVCLRDVRAAGPRLLRSLDLEREALARLPHRLVFWVTEDERLQLAERAPNFYSRLSGMFLFLDQAEQAREARIRQLTLPPVFTPVRLLDLTLTPQQRRALREALLEAFPFRADVELVVRFGLDWNLREIVGGGSLEDTVFDLIRYAEATGRIGDLIRAALDANPTNANLRAFALEVGVLAPPTSPPTSLTLAPIERAERYQALQAAHAAGEWERVLELAAGIEQYREVPQLVAEARGLLLEELADAYAADDWAAVLRLARQLGAAAPLEVASWVALARREVPVQERLLIGHTEAVSAVAVTPDGQQALSGSLDGTLRLWDFATGQAVRTFAGHTGAVSAVAATPDGRQALSGSDDGTLRLWDLATGQELRAFADHSGTVSAVAVTPDGQQVLSGSKVGTLRLWDLVTGQAVRAFMGDTGPVNDLAVTPDGRQALSGSGEGTLRLWDLPTGKAVRTFMFIGHTLPVYAVAVTSDGRQALSGSLDGTLRLWDLATGQTVRFFTAHKGPVFAVAVTPDGQQALSGSLDETLRLWDLATGQELRTLTGHKESVYAVAISPDGRIIVSGGEDRAVHVWTLPVGLLG